MDNTTQFKLGPFSVEVTHHSWDCGSGCCSTSGNTAVVKEINKNPYYYGDTEYDGEYNAEEFAELALTEYLKERDLSIQMDRQDAIYVDRELVREERNNFLEAIAVAYKVLNEIEPEIFRKSKGGEEAYTRIVCLRNYLRKQSGDYSQTLYMYELPEDLGM